MVANRNKSGLTTVKEFLNNWTHTRAETRGIIIRAKARSLETYLCSVYSGQQMHKELLCVLLSVGGELWMTTPYHSFEHVRGNAILFLEDKTKAKHEALHKSKCTMQK